MWVYISGITPKTGPERILRAKEEIQKRGCTPLAMPQGEAMEHLLPMLNSCSGIYMMRGWEKSPEANRAYGYARGRGKKILEEPKACENCWNYCGGNCIMCRQYDGQECHQNGRQCAECVDMGNWEDGVL